MAFDFKKSLIKVQGGRSYLPVSARLIWFREEHPDWGIETEPVAIDTEKQYAIFRARIYNAEGKLMAVGTKMENVKGFPDYLEKAETGSVGRALALCGYGTQFSPELDEVGSVGRARYADSPQPTGGSQQYGGNQYGSGGNRYGNPPAQSGNGGSRFSAPPREISEPNASERPIERPAEREERPMPTARAGSANTSTGNNGMRPAPAAAHIPEEEDFEALVGGEARLDSAEDDPFDGGQSAAPVSVPARPAAAAAPSSGPSSNGMPACTGCGKALTKAQQDLSIRNYGEALCPACQKDKSRTPRAAMAG